MPIPDNEWGQLREDVGFIKATVAALSDLPRRVSVLEEDSRDAKERIRLIMTRRDRIVAKAIIAVGVFCTLAGTAIGIANFAGGS